MTKPNPKNIKYLMVLNTESSLNGNFIIQANRKDINPCDNRNFSFVQPAIENELNSEQIMEPIQALYFMPNT